MKKMLLLGVLLAGMPAMAGAESPKPMEGVWKVVEVVATGARAENTANPPSLFMFGPKHYSMMWVRGGKPRAPYAGEVPTSEEKVAAFDSFVASTGTYEVTGSSLTVRPIVARSPNFMAGGSSQYQFRVDGTHLWLTEKSTDTRYRIAGEVRPPSAPASETRLKLERVQ